MISSGSEATSHFHARAIASSVLSFTYEQNIICSQTQLDDIAHEQTIICRSSGGFSASEKEEKLASNDKKAALILHWREKLCFSKAKFWFYRVSP